MDAQRRRKAARQKGSVVDQLRRAIQDSGQTEYAIAKAADVDQANLNAFVNGKRGLSLPTFARLCEHFGLELRGR